MWQYAREHGFTIVTKDSDFRQQSFLYRHPPKVVRIRRGNRASSLSHNDQSIALVRPTTSTTHVPSKTTFCIRRNLSSPEKRSSPYDPPTPSPLNSEPHGRVVHNHHVRQYGSVSPSAGPRASLVSISPQTSSISSSPRHRHEPRILEGSLSPSLKFSLSPSATQATTYPRQCLASPVRTTDATYQPWTSAIARQAASPLPMTLTCSAKRRSSSVVVKLRLFTRPEPNACSSAEDWGGAVTSASTSGGTTNS